MFQNVPGSPVTTAALQPAAHCSILTNLKCKCHVGLDFGFVVPEYQLVFSFTFYTDTWIQWGQN